MRDYEMLPSALETATACARNQTFFAVFASRKQSAHVIELHIAKSLADRAARKVQGCVRVGHCDLTQSIFKAI